jgi:hypothetical protein
MISSEVSALLCRCALHVRPAAVCGTALCLFKLASMKYFVAFLLKKN